MLGINIVWKGKGINEVGIDKQNKKILVKIDKFFYRPSEVDFLLSDPTKANKELKWKSKTKIDQLITLMVESDYNRLKKKL